MLATKNPQKNNKLYIYIYKIQKIHQFGTFIFIWQNFAPKSLSIVKIW
jgi:hypothetical protein